MADAFIKDLKSGAASLGIHLDILRASTAILIALIAASPGAARAAADPKVTHFTLGNGLEVVVVPDHRAPVVTHMIWYKVGAADEAPGKSGLRRS